MPIKPPLPTWHLPRRYGSIRTALLCLLLLPPLTAMAQGFVSGQVVSIDRGKGEFVLLVTPGAEQRGRNLPPGDKVPAGQQPASRDNEQDKTPGRTITVTTDADPKKLPTCLLPGGMARAWGAFAPGSTTRFMADTIRGTGPWGQDRSGVRSRLHRCQGSGQGYRNGGGKQGGNRKGRLP